MNYPHSLRPRAEKQASQMGDLLTAAVLACGLVVTPAAVADIYHFTAEDGTSHYSDRPSDARFHLLSRSGEEPRASLTGEPPRKGLRYTRERFDTAIALAAQASRVEAEFLHAVIEIESGYNPKAVSPKGALGLMQLMPTTARRYGVSNPLDIAQNLRGGAHLLRDLLDQFSDDKELALAAYNAGAGAVLAHGRRIPPYAETSRYVPAVMQLYKRQRKADLSPAD